jgi:hypothetical protein
VSAEVAVGAFIFGAGFGGLAFGWLQYELGIAEGERRAARRQRQLEWEARKARASAWGYRQEAASRARHPSTWGKA